MINKLVLFDWNGTFVDDEVQTTTAFREVLKGVGDERWQLPLDDLVMLHRKSFEIPLSKMYLSLGLSSDQAKRAKENSYWKQKYFSLEETIQPQPGIAESIALIKNHDASFGILSNHTKSAISESLDRYGYQEPLILANDHDHEAHIEGKLHRLESYLQKHPRTSIVAIIGDSIEEIDIARMMKTASVAVTNGWLAADKLEAANPDYLIHSSQLPTTLQEIFKK